MTQLHGRHSRATSAIGGDDEASRIYRKATASGVSSGPRRATLASSSWRPRRSASNLQEIDYYGLAALEYKLDGADGQFKLLDVNTRTWGYHSVGYVAGVDFPLLL